MKSKKFIALIAAVVLTTGILGGCSSKKGTDTSASGQVTINLGVWASSPAETKLLDDQIKEFETTNKNIKIVKQVITNDYNQAMQAKIASKTEPDVYYLDVSLAPAYMSKGVIQPIDQYLDKEDVKDFAPNLLAGYQKDGKTYGLPKDYNTLALFYNKEMFDKAGVSVPTTWTELQDAAKKLTTDKVKGIVLANDSARFAPFIMQAGGKMMDGDKIAFNTSEAAKGLDYYYSFFKNKTAATPKDLGEGWNGDALAHGKTAMVIEGGWMIPFMKESAPNIKYGIANLPKGDKEGDLAFTVAYVMSKNTKNAKQAAEVIKFLTGKKAQQMTADSGLAIPTRSSVASSFIDKYPERKALVDMTKFAEVWQYGINHAKINDELGKASEKLQLNKVPDAKSALEEAANNLK